MTGKRQPSQQQLQQHSRQSPSLAPLRKVIVVDLQVSAHGTGAGIPPVDEQAVALTLVTPGQGTLELSVDKDPELFRLARVGLGALGIVTDVTLQCVPVHRLLEHTFVASVKVRCLHRALSRGSVTISDCGSTSVYDPKQRRRTCIQARACKFVHG